ncbi:hypothetical protein EJ08DRAFT_714213 [Tothia fuscella]|uniref:Uncharacterized protein n=1 Tax=Tothia fuscella TaxID=1048955 RepID=A0A9P4NT63_9PEZI|nr:hypothetical protein EJ08DRAFT_714213 [Tothia fuscella]
MADSVSFPLTFRVVRIPIDPDLSLDPCPEFDFVPPRESDQLFDVLCIAYPKGITHRERMIEAVVDFVNSENKMAATDLTNQAPLRRLMIPSPGLSASTLSVEKAELDVELSESIDKEPWLQMTSSWRSTHATNKARPRVPMNSKQREEYRYRRGIGACGNCKRKKKKCTHFPTDSQSMPKASGKLEPPRLTDKLSSRTAVENGLRVELRDQVTDCPNMNAVPMADVARYSEGRLSPSTLTSIATSEDGAEVNPPEVEQTNAVTVTVQQLWPYQQLENPITLAPALEFYEDNMPQLHTDLDTSDPNFDPYRYASLETHFPFDDRAGLGALVSNDRTTTQRSTFKIPDTMLKFLHRHIPASTFRKTPKGHHGQPPIPPLPPPRRRCVPAGLGTSDPGAHVSIPNRATVAAPPPPPKPNRLRGAPFRSDYALHRHVSPLPESDERGPHEASLDVESATGTDSMGRMTLIHDHVDARDCAAALLPPPKTSSNRSSSNESAKCFSSKGSVLSRSEGLHNRAKAPSLHAGSQRGVKCYSYLDRHSENVLRRKNKEQVSEPSKAIAKDNELAAGFQQLSINPARATASLKDGASELTTENNISWSDNQPNVCTALLD